MIEQAGSFVKGLFQEFSLWGLLIERPPPPPPHKTTRNKLVHVLLAWTGRTGWERRAAQEKQASQ
jgi:hypothetical protein